MHSSRMHTGCSLTVCRQGWGEAGSDPHWFPPWVWAWIWSPSISPLGMGLDLIPLNFPLGCGPGSDPPQFPPWMWAWIWSPLNFPLGCGPGSDPPQFLPWVWAWTWSPSISPLGVGLGGLLGRVGGCIPACTDADPPVNRITDTSKNITLPTTSICGR